MSLALSIAGHGTYTGDLPFIFHLNCAKPIYLSPAKTTHQTPSRKSPIEQVGEPLQTLTMIMFREVMLVSSALIFTNTSLATLVLS